MGRQQGWHALLILNKRRPSKLTYRLPYGLPRVTLRRRASDAWPRIGRYALVLSAAILVRPSHGIESWGPCTGQLPWESQRLVQGANRCLIPALEKTLLAQKGIDASFRFNLLRLTGRADSRKPVPDRQYAWALLTAAPDAAPPSQFNVAYHCSWRKSGPWRCEEGWREKVVYYQGRAVLTRSDPSAAIRALRSLSYTPPREFLEARYWRYQANLGRFYQTMWEAGAGHLNYRPDFQELSIEGKVSLWAGLFRRINPPVYAVNVLDNGDFLYSLGNYQCPFPNLRARPLVCSNERCELKLPAVTGAASC